MQNVWLIYSEAKRHFPIGSKAKVVWPHHKYDGWTGAVHSHQHFTYRTTGVKYGVTIELAFWHQLYGTIYEKIPVANLVPNNSHI